MNHLLKPIAFFGRAVLAPCLNQLSGTNQWHNTNQPLRPLLYMFFMLFTVAELAAQSNVSAPITVEIKLCNKLSKGISESDAAPVRNNRYAFIVGINKYESKTIPELKHTKNDVRNVENYFSRLLGIPQSNITVMGKNDDDIVFANTLKRRLTSFVERLPQNGNTEIFFYYSGHAVNYNNMQYLTVFDTDISREVEHEYSSFIPLNYIIDELSGSSASVISFVDACGGVGKFVPLPTGGLSIPGETILFNSSLEGAMSFEFAEECSGVFTFHLLHQLSILRKSGNDFSYKKWFDATKSSIGKKHDLKPSYNYGIEGSALLERLIN